MEYHINESVPTLVQDFDFFVKGGSLGVAPILPSLPGSISSFADTAKGELHGALQCVKQNNLLLVQAPQVYLAKFHLYNFVTDPALIFLVTCLCSIDQLQCMLYNQCKQHVHYGPAKNLWHWKAHSFLNSTYCINPA